MVIVVGICCVDKGPQFVRVAVLLSPITTTSTAMLFFLREFSHFDQCFLPGFDRRTHEQYNPLRAVLIPTMLQSELRHLDTFYKIQLAANRSVVQRIENVAHVVRRAHWNSGTHWPVDAMVRTPTLDSGFCCIFAPTTRLAASCWLSCLVGVKSPFLINSLVSRHIIVDSRGMVAGAARALVARGAFLSAGAGRTRERGVARGCSRRGDVRRGTLVHSGARRRRAALACARAVIGCSSVRAALYGSGARRRGLH